MNIDTLTARLLREASQPDLPLLFENYVRTTRLLELDPWQVNLCQHLEESFWLSRYELFKDRFQTIDMGVGRPYQIAPSGFKIDQQVIDRRATHGSRVAIHAPPQFGKSIIISQSYPAWVLGWDPMHRFRLATYNVFHSGRFSRVIIHLLKSPEHRELFPGSESQLPAKHKVVEWSTNARTAHPDGQASFTALGLQSGFTGTGYDTLLMDDPYKGMEEALSEVIRDKTWRFWTDTAAVRAQEHSNVFIMFHRYHQDDMGGRAILTGDFELWRYAAQADGDYSDEELGSDVKFPDPLNRQEGEYLSPRFGEPYYLRQKKNEQVWYSMFQGRPSAKTGKMFNVSLLKPIARAQVPNIIHRVRAWDNAATEGAGAFTAGVDMGVDASGRIYLFDVERKQVGTAERALLQLTVARNDGKLVEIHVPQDPGSAGKDVAFQFQQDMSKEGFVVTVTKVSGSKESRAYPFSKAVGSDQARLVLAKDGSVPPWHKVFKGEATYFPNSTYKDQIDAASDAYSELMRKFHRGLVIKTAGEHNLLGREVFAQRFGEKIAAHWEVAVGVRLAPDSSRPSGYAITARAGENAHIGETLFVVAAARMYVDNPLVVINALRADLLKYCENGISHPQVIWLNRGGGDILQVAAQKLDLRLSEFRDEVTAGLPECNWYFQPLPYHSPFHNQMGTTRCHVLCDDSQLHKRNLRDEGGMLSLRQDWATWSYNDMGQPQPQGGITLDCVRMTMYKFALSATSLTAEERIFAQLPPELQPEAVRAKLGTPAFVEAHFAQTHAIATIRMQEADKKTEQFRAANRDQLSIGPRAVTRRYRKNA